MASLMDQVQAAYPQAKWIQWEPVNRDNVRAGAQMAFGQYVETRYDLEKADIDSVARRRFSLQRLSRASCIMRGSSPARRNPDLKEKMSRFYSVQSTPTNTSGKADHRLPVRASEVEAGGARDRCGLGAGGGSTATSTLRSRSLSPPW